MENLKISKGIFEAASKGELVLFIGAGISRLLGCPSWEQFNSRILDHLRSVGEINYAEQQALSLLETKKQLSIAIELANRKNIKLDYEQILMPSGQDPEMKGLYEALYSIGSVFITTNYDKYLDDLALKSKHLALANKKTSLTKEEEILAEAKVYFLNEDLKPERLNELKSVLHIHGSVVYPPSMVVTTHDYLLHYQNPTVINFLQELFTKKVVLFLGYGLEEEDILVYALKRGHKQKSKYAKEHYWLYPFLDRDTVTYNYLKDYFIKNFNVSTIPLKIDNLGFKQVAYAIYSLAEQLKKI